MLDHKLSNRNNKELCIKQIKIIDIDKVEDYLFIILDNDQKILTNGKDLYDVSDYNHLLSVFQMGDKFCAVMTKNFSKCVVDLKTMEILFEDKKAYHISKQDDRTLHIIMKIGCGNNTIYDIETKKYLQVPDNYEYENSLGNNLYVFKEQHDLGTNFYDDKRCVINADGKILLKDITGWIELCDDYFILKKKTKLCIVNISEDSVLDMKMVEQNERMIAKPSFYNGGLIILTKGAIKMYTPNLKLINEYIVEELNDVVNYEIVADTLKICLSYKTGGRQKYKHLFINLKTGKRIFHIRIEGFPYWMPTAYVAQDSLELGITDYHFYNANFEPIITVAANSYESVEIDKCCMFVIRVFDGKKEHRRLLNVESGILKDVDYDDIHFHLSLPYGYGVKRSTKKIDFFDTNLNIIIPNFDYKKFDLDLYHKKLSYFIVNDYICIYYTFIDDYGQSRLRTIIQKANGEVVLDSIQHECYAIGNYIQIIHDKSSEFLNTLTGEIRPLEISSAVDENGKIIKTDKILSTSDSALLGLTLIKEKNRN